MPGLADIFRGIDTAAGGIAQGMGVMNELRYKTAMEEKKRQQDMEDKKQLLTMEYGLKKQAITHKINAQLKAMGEDDLEFNMDDVDPSIVDEIESQGNLSLVKMAGTNPERVIPALIGQGGTLGKRTITKKRGYGASGPTKETTITEGPWSPDEQKAQMIQGLADIEQGKMAQQREAYAETVIPWGARGLQKPALTLADIVRQPRAVAEERARVGFARKEKEAEAMATAMYREPPRPEATPDKIQIYEYWKGQGASDEDALARSGMVAKPKRITPAIDDAGKVLFKTRWDPNDDTQFEAAYNYAQEKKVEVMGAGAGATTEARQKVEYPAELKTEAEFRVFTQAKTEYYRSHKIMLDPTLPGSEAKEATREKAATAYAMAAVEAYRRGDTGAPPPTPAPAPPTGGSIYREEKERYK